MKINVVRVILNIAVCTAISALSKFIFNDINFTTPELLSSLLSGTIFGSVMTWLQHYNRRKQSEALANTMKVPLEEGETLIFEDNANLFKGQQAIGGKMLLTNKRLIFTPHRHNADINTENFFLQEIMGASETKIGSDINNALLLTLSNNVTERIVVNLPLKWVENIELQRRAA
jgi:hypothetical protein